MPRSPARKLTDRLAVIDSDIYEGPGDTHCSGVGCDVTDHQVLIETSVKHRTKVGASKKHLFKRHPIDFSFTKETQSIDIFPSRQELYLNRFFFPSLLMRCNFTGMKIKKKRSSYSASQLSGAGTSLSLLQKQEGDHGDGGSANRKLGSLYSVPLVSSRL